MPYRSPHEIPGIADAGVGDWTAVADETLLSAIATAEDKAAFAELFRRFSGKIKAYLIRAGVTHSEAEEAAQEVLVAIWRKSTQFDPARAGAATWIYTIARNRRIDLARRAKRAEPDPDDPAFRADPEPSPEVAFSGGERDSRVRDAIAALPDDQRAVIRLAFFNGLSHSEIAEELGTPLGTVKSRLRLSFVRLREDLGLDFAHELVDP